MTRRHCKPVHQSQSQNCAIFTSHIWSILWKTNIRFFPPKYLGLPVHTKYFVKKNCLFPQEGLHFRYFNLTLGHFYTFNTRNSQKKLFHIIVDMVNKFHLQPITVLGAEQFAFLWNVFFAEFQLKKFSTWAETKTGLCWGRKNSESIWRFSNILDL